ncbi:MAG: carbohydrate ABC transporter permease [Beutenbergiaceae bacterium]
MATSAAPAPGSSIADAPQSGDGARKRRHRTPGGMGWMLPGFVVSAGLIYACVVYVAWVSLLAWDWRPILPPVIEGLDNYVRAFEDRIFWMSLSHTVVFFIGSFVVLVAVGIIFAAMLHSKVYLPTLFKIIIFTPVVIAPAIMAPVHRRVWAVDGPVNAVLEWIGLVNVTGTGTREWTGWLASVLNAIGLEELTPNWIQPTTSLWVIVAAQLFSSVGISFILFYAAMGQVDPSTLEAARIDGAGNVRTLWSIVVPAVRPTILSLAILHAITSLKLFEYPYLITAGGPANSSEFLGTHIYNQLFGISNNYGYASALSVLLFALSLGVAIAMSRSARERNPRPRRIKKKAVSNV